MIIVGAGMTGLLAGVIHKEAQIHEIQKQANTHTAVLRFRSDNISKVTGIPFKKVKVQKAIVVNGEFVSPNLRLENLYSQKVTGGLYARSISDTNSVERWIAPDNFHEQLDELCGNRVHYNSDILDIPRFKDETMISTIPLPVLAKHLKMNISCDTNYSGITTMTCIVDDCDVYQTIYFPGNETHVYRASITGNKLIIESSGKLDLEDLTYVTDCFGVKSFVTGEIFQKEIGKIIPLDKEYRENLLYEITTRHGIYSLGRLACWRNTLLDDCLKDIYKIEQMINTSAYQRMIAR